MSSSAETASIPVRDQGITHSEMNSVNDDFLRFLQIWVQPRQKGLHPFYKEKNLLVKRKMVLCAISPQVKKGKA